jgi:hypothetical protein
MKIYAMLYSAILFVPVIVIESYDAIRKVVKVGKRTWVSR